MSIADCICFAFNIMSITINIIMLINMHILCKPNPKD